MVYDQSETAKLEGFYWTSIGISAVISLQFIIGGRYRHKWLKKIGFGQRSYYNFSRLQKTKMLLFIALTGINIAIFVATLIEDIIRQRKQQRSEIALHELPRGHIIAITVSLLVIELMDVVVSIFATILRHTEYVKEASEALYSHKLYIYSSFLLRLLHGLIFHHFFTGLQAALTFSRLMILLSLAVCIWLTTKRNPMSRVTASQSSNMIRKSTLLEPLTLKDPQVIEKQPEEYISFLNKVTPKGSVKSSGTVPREKLQLTATLILVKVEKIKRYYDQYQLVFSTHLLNLPPQVPLAGRSIELFSPMLPMMEALDDDDSFLSADLHHEKHRRSRSLNVSHEGFSLKKFWGKIRGKFRSKKAAKPEVVV